MTTKPRTYGRIDQPTIPALGKLSEEYEAAEEAHGSLHGFHRLCTNADSTPSKAVYLLHRTGARRTRQSNRTQARRPQCVRWAVKQSNCRGMADPSPIFKRLEAKARQHLADGSATRTRRR